MVTYGCTAATYEEFGTIYRVLIGGYATADDLKAARDILEYFGILIRDCLVMIVDEAERESQEAPKDVGKPPKAKKRKSEAAAATTAQEAFISNLALDPSGTLVICSSEERTTIASQLARDLGLSYVPFKIFFAEGE